MRNAEIAILKIFLKRYFSIIIKLFLLSNKMYIKTPIQVDIEVDMGIIINPISLKKLKLIIIFDNTTKKDM